MPAINPSKSGGTKAKPGAKPAKAGKKSGVGAGTVVIAMICAALMTATGLVGYYTFVLQPNQTAVSDESGSVASGELKTVYVAAMDLNPGDMVSGAVKEVQVPGSLVVADTAVPGFDINSYRVSRKVSGGSVLRMTDIYNPEFDKVVKDTSREVTISFLTMRNVNPDDFIDIRLKTYLPNNGDMYDDDVVVSKARVVDISDAGVTMVLTEADIVNLNNAYAETNNGELKCELYVTKYVDPANQPIAPVTYTGAGTGKEIRNDPVYENANGMGNSMTSSEQLDSGVEENSNSDLESSYEESSVGDLETSSDEFYNGESEVESSTESSIE